MTSLCRGILALGGKENARGVHATLGRPAGRVQLPHYFPYGLKEYCRRGRKNLFPDLYGCPNPCCWYEGRLHRHGFYTRNALSILFTSTAVIQRYLCPRCKKTVSILPTYFAPHFQYSYACIVFALYLLAVCRLTMSDIAATINEFSGQLKMSYQHIAFYRNRLWRNTPLVIMFFGSIGVILAEYDAPSSLRFIGNVLEGLEELGMDYFTIMYFHFHKKHLMSKR